MIVSPARIQGIFGISSLDPRAPKAISPKASQEGNAIMKKKTRSGASHKKAIRDKNDDTQIEAETMHIADRDQLFSIIPAPKEVAGGISEESRDTWSGDYEEIIKGTRDLRHDTVDELAEARRTRSLWDTEQEFEEMRDGGAREGPERLDGDDRPPADTALEEMTENELLATAKALGIPGHEHMDRSVLISHINEAQGAA